MCNSEALKEKKVNFGEFGNSNSNNNQAFNFQDLLHKLQNLLFRDPPSASSRLSGSSPQTSEHSPLRLLSSACSRKEPCAPGAQRFQSSMLFKWNSAPFFPVQTGQAQPVEDVAAWTHYVTKQNINITSPNLFLETLALACTVSLCFSNLHYIRCQLITK